MQVKAMVRHDYGGPEALSFEAVDVPGPGPSEVRIRVAYASVNPADRYHLLGWPYMIRVVDGLRRPGHPGLGIDVAGVVESVGPGVTDVEVGDRIVGASEAGYAELALVGTDHLAVLPDEVELADAAALPVAGLTALQGLRLAEVAAGDRVLVNGASGGVGHYAVQLAVAAGAEVTGVCSTRNVDLVRDLGASDVVDYTTTDYTTLARTWDVLFDNHGNHVPRANLDVVEPDGTWVLVNGPMTSSLVGPMTYIMRAKVAAIRRPQRVVQFTAAERAEDLEVLVAHLAAGEIAPHVERTFPLADLPDAMRHLGTNRTRGKLLVQVQP